MSSSDDALISIKLSADRLHAHLVVMPGIDRAYVSADVALAKALSQALRPGPQLSGRIKKALEAFEKHDLGTQGEFRAALAEGTSAVDGEDGRFALEPELETIHLLSLTKAAAKEQQPTKPSTDETLDHRSRTTLMVVKAGQRIGTIAKATEGTDGIDVAGNTIKAKPGKSIATKFDAQTIECHEGGAVIAKVAGQLVYEHDDLHVCPTLVVDGYVDYSTGNIDFPGNIEVRKGVRDCFHVVSGRTITVGGLVEAAELTSARDIELLGGIAAREKGRVQAGRDLLTRYLNGAAVHVGRNLVVEREICDCTVAVTGNITSPKAAVMGGTLSAMGRCEIAQAGSEAGAHTVICIGRADTLDGLVSQSLRIIGKLEEKIGAAKKQIRDLRADPDASSIKAEMMTSLQFEASECEAKLMPLKESLRATLKLIDSKAEAVLHVHEYLYSGVEIRAGGHKAVLTQSLKGPLTVTLDENGELVCTDLTSGSVKALRSVAKVTPDDTTFSRTGLPEDLRKAG